MCSCTIFSSCVCFCSFHTRAPSKSVVAAPVDMATWQSAFSSHWLMTCRDFCWWKWDHLHRRDLFLSLQWRANWKYNGVSIAVSIHANESPQRMHSLIWMLLFMCMFTVLYVAVWMYLEYLQVTVCLGVCMNLFMDSNSKHLLVICIYFVWQHQLPSLTS